MFETRPLLLPTAVFCFSDRIALGALEAFEERAVRVPGDISVLGFDDIEEAAHSRPALTTIRQSTRLVGERAAQTLLGLIDGTLPAHHQEVVPVEFIARASVGAPPVRSAPSRKGNL
jgi:DNA-binding LacI/PurR family transcriptional regulator